MAPSEEHRMLAKAIISELLEADDTCMGQLTKEERLWVASGNEHLDHKHWPLLGDFVSVLRKALLIIVSGIIVALIIIGIMSAFDGVASGIITK